MPTPQNPASTIFVADDDRYDGRMPYPRVGRSGLRLPEISLGLWNNFGSDRPIETQRAILRRAFDLGVTHFDLANNYGPVNGGRRAQLRADLPRRLRAVPRRAHHLDQGRLRHVARPVRRVGIAQVPAQLARPVAEAHGARLRRHLLLAPTRPRDADRRDDGRAGHGRAVRARRCTRASRTTTPSRPAPPSSRCSAEGIPLLIHQPRYNMFDRAHGGRTVPGAGRDRRRLDRVLAARAGHADRSLPQRHPR